MFDADNLAPVERLAPCLFPAHQRLFSGVGALDSWTLVAWTSYFPWCHRKCLLDDATVTPQNWDYSCGACSCDSKSSCVPHGATRLFVLQRGWCERALIIKLKTFHSQRPSFPLCSGGVGPEYCSAVQQNPSLILIIFNYIKSYGSYGKSDKGDDGEGWKTTPLS